eukprot:2670958-Pyramimonas_sp.AAC.1
MYNGKKCAQLAMHQLKLKLLLRHSGPFGHSISTRAQCSVLSFWRARFDRFDAGPEPARGGAG